MKRHRSDFVLLSAVGVFLIALVFVMFLHPTDKTTAFDDACKKKGGVVVHTRGPLLCIRKDVVL